MSVPKTRIPRTVRRDSALPSQPAPTFPVEAEYREMCGRLRACVERSDLGLGGENLDELVIAAYEKIRKISCFVPGKIWIEAKEAAGFGEAIKPKNQAPSQPAGERSPIPLNTVQDSAIKEWSADDRLWTTQETVEFNLRTFARVILAARSSSPEGEPQGLKQEYAGFLTDPLGEPQDIPDTCIICGKVIPPGPDTCSPDCEDKLRQESEIEKLAAAPSREWIKRAAEEIRAEITRQIAKNHVYARVANGGKIEEIIARHAAQQEQK